MQAAWCLGGLQALALPALLKGGDYMLASHTGSGKTLAYLLPIVSTESGGCINNNQINKNAKIIIIIIECDNRVT